MNLLPDMIVIDFCEWLRQFSNPGESLENAIQSLMLDKHNNRKIRSLAHEFLREYNPSIRDIMHQFIDSTSFDEYLHDYEITFRTLKNLSRSDIERFLCNREFVNCFNGFYSENIKAYYSYLDYDTDYAEKMLIDSLQYRFEHPSPLHISCDRRQCYDSKQMLSLIVNSEVELKVCTDFLSWLSESTSEPINIFNISNDDFQKLATKFCNECGKSNDELKKLIHAFRFKNARSLYYKLASGLSLRKLYRVVDLCQIINRYQMNDAQFKCFFVIRKAHADEFKDFIYKFGDDLHELSGDFLDIFYSPAEFNQSGYTLTQSMKYIPEKLKGRAPIIVLWKNNLDEACGIDIGGLDPEDYIAVISKIIELIKMGYEIDRIEEEASKMCKKLRNEHRPIVDNSIHDSTIIGTNINNQGVQTVIETQRLRIYIKTFADETQTAVEEINKLTDISEKQRKAVIDILEDSCEAVRLQDENKQEICKARFSDVMVFIGDKILPIIANLATIASFFCK